MEKAIMISNLEIAAKKLNEYSRIYWGNEFCPNDMITLKDVEEAVSFCSENKRNLTLVTPYMTEINMKKLEDILKYLKINNVKCEIVVNDWGVLYYINKYYNGEFDIVLGRLLNKMKKSPIIMNYKRKLSLSSQLILSTSSTNLTPTIEILKKYNVVRVEFENVLQGLHIEKNYPFEKSLVYPYVFITTSRKCISDYIFNKRKNYNLNACSKVCKKQKLRLFNKVMGRDVILRGNTYYFENDELPDNIKDFSRIVYQEI